MKTILTVVIFSLLAGSAMATPKGINACDSRSMKYLQESIAEGKSDGMVNVKLMKNSRNETLGYYAWDAKNEQMHAEICEYLSTDDMTVANKWYYWDQEGEYRTSPSSWKSNGVYSISQDEGIATMTMLKTSSKGDVTIKLEIVGVEDDVIRSEVVRFTNP